MHEVATVWMRSAPGWIETPTSSVFQFGDAVMTIFPNGNWRYVMSQGITQAVRSGNVNNLERFLQDFAAAHPL